MKTDYTIEVFSKKACAGCDKVKAMLKSRGLVYKEYMVDSEDGLAKQELFARVPGVRTVPQVFIDGKLIGGAEALVKELATNDYS